MVSNQQTFKLFKLFKPFKPQLETINECYNTNEYSKLLSKMEKEKIIYLGRPLSVAENLEIVAEIREYFANIDK
jgi:hypothetical protein